MRVARFEGRGPKAALGVSSSVFARNVHGDASVALAWGPARRSQPAPTVETSAPRSSRIAAACA